MFSLKNEENEPQRREERKGKDKPAYCQPTENCAKLPSGEKLGEKGETVWRSDLKPVCLSSS
jgi:hypothetical protein